MNLQKRIKELEKELSQKKIYLDNLKEVYKKYPDSQISYNRSMIERVFSPEINDERNEVEIYYNETLPSEIRIYFYKIVDNIKVYGKPLYVVIGETQPVINWKEVLRENYISYELIKKVEEKFKEK